jgi:hypothetical protein
MAQGRPSVWVLAICISFICGCDFFLTPPEPEPDPLTDGILSCGELMDIEGLEAGSTIPIDVPQGTSVIVQVDLTDPVHIGRLRTESDTRLFRALPVWDPLLEQAILPGFRGTGEQLTLELLGADSNGFSGSVSLQCTSPGEICFNLTDDDSDSLVDCADIHCARDTSCSDDQHDLEERVLTCSDEFQQLDPPELRTFDDQRTLYTRPDSEWPEFWGGAELLLGATLAAGTIELTFGEEGMVCVGGLVNQVTACETIIEVSSGETRAFPTEDLPLRLEPLGPTWIDLQARLVCD